jgi:hypothetical protein
MVINYSFSHTCTHIYTNTDQRSGIFLCCFGIHANAPPNLDLVPAWDSHSHLNLYLVFHIYNYVKCLLIIYIEKFMKNQRLVKIHNEVYFGFIGL